MRRDTLNTVTGWKTLDKLTLPFWSAYCAWQKWRLYRTIGAGDYHLGKRIFREVVINHPAFYDPTIEAERILEENNNL